MPGAGEVGGTGNVRTWLSLPTPDPLPHLEPTLRVRVWPLASWKHLTPL